METPPKKHPRTSESRMDQNGFDVKELSKKFALLAALLISPAYADEKNQNQGNAPDGPPEPPTTNQSDQNIAEVQSSSVARILSTTGQPINSISALSQRMNRHVGALSIFHESTKYLLQDIDRINATISERLREKRTRVLINTFRSYTNDLELIGRDFEDILRKNQLTNDPANEEMERLSQMLKQAESRFRSIQDTQNPPTSTEPSTLANPPPSEEPSEENTSHTQLSQRLRDLTRRLEQAENNAAERRVLDEIQQELLEIKEWSRTRYNREE